MHSKPCFIFGLIFLLIFTITSSVPWVHGQGGEDWRPRQWVEEIIEDISMKNIKEHVRVLSSYQSRMTGYPGCEKAANYIYNYLANELGLNVWNWTYNVLVPIDHGSTVTVTFPEHKVIKAYALMPNGIQTCKTPPGGLSGRLIYVEDGDPEDFNGFDVNGSIVLMKFNSKGNWVNAMIFGAKAVILWDTSWTVRGEMDYKSLMAPVKFPRLYISDEDAMYLLKLLGPDRGRSTVVKVSVDVNMLWENVEAKNIFAFINGTRPDLYNQTVMVAAYYDAASEIPAIAPGAEEALGVSSLLELARILKEHPPRRPVIIAAFSGEYFAMSGARAFAEDLFFHHWRKDHAKVARGSLYTFRVYGDQIRITFVLDFSTGSDRLVFTPTGFFMGGWDWSAGRGGPFPGDYFLNKLGVYDKMNYVHTIGGRSYKVFLALPLMEIRGERAWLPSTITHLAEVLNAAGSLAVAFYTASDARLRCSTPNDRFEFIKFENLKPQVEYSFSIIYLVVNDVREETIRVFRDSMMHRPSRGAGGVMGSAIMRGLVGRFNYTKSWYDYDWSRILGNDGQLLVQVRHAGPTQMLYRHYFIVEAMKNGTFLIPGLRPSGWAIGETRYEVTAYVYNRTTGNIEWATDLGYYGTRLWPFGMPVVLMSDEEVDGRRPVHISLFRAGTIIIHDALDPRTLSPPLVSAMRPMDFRVYVTGRGTAPPHYSYYIAAPLPPPLIERLIRLGIGDPTLGYDALIFVPPDVPVDVVFLGSGGEVPLGILRGIKVEAGKYLDVPLTAFKYAGEFISLAGGRLEKLRHEVAVGQALIPAINDYNIAVKSYDKALKALHGHRYSQVYPNIYKSWFYARKVYETTRATLVDIIYSAVFFFLLLVPFAIILERLVIHEPSIKRIIYISLIYILSAAFIYVMHPGLRLAANTSMVILGFLSFILTLPVLGLMATRFWEIAKLIRRRVIGPHFVKVARTAEFSSALSIGIENMRRRKLRTTLTLVTIIIIVFSLTSFTALTFHDILKENPLPVKKPPYTGMLVKGPESESGGGNLPLTPTVLEYLKALSGSEAVFAPRAWLIPPYDYFHAYNKAGAETEVYAVIGLTPQEVLWKRIFKLVITPSRPFEPEDRFVCFISKDIADRLDVDMGDSIFIAGVKFHILGIIDNKEFWKLVDIDGELITPLDPTLARAGTRVRVNHDFIIIPYEIAVRLGAVVPSVAIKYENADLAREKASLIARHLSTYLSVYYSARGASYFVTWIKGYRIFGLALVVIPFVLAALALLNIMLGHVYERTRYISIYSAVGLSPMHIAMMFLMESIVFAVLGATLGYILSLLIGGAVATFAPGMIMTNYTSAYVILSVTASMVTVIISSIYPSIKASRLVTPSLERVWRVPTKPIGTEWTIPLPFSFDEDEALGSLVYLGEYLERFGTEAASFMIEEGPKYVSRALPKMIVRGVEATVRLRPYDAGVVESISLIASRRMDEEKYTFELRGVLRTGQRYLWISGHRVVADQIRKQLLLWRSLIPSDKIAYMKRSRSIFKAVEVEKSEE
ncbi:M28 family peptidase [Candidatus Bathyarchaeota archaeon]|nr:M28 family peptidase [Candidatus Bathyarchaeota archaeon]